MHKLIYFSTGVKALENGFWGCSLSEGLCSNVAYLYFRQTSKAAALYQQQQQQQAAQQAHQQQQQQKQQQQTAAMSALTQLTLQTDSQSSQDYNNELQIVDENGDPVNWQDDPNEPRYCLCNQVSYGEMVGCDNNDVSENKMFYYTCDVYFYQLCVCIHTQVIILYSHIFVEYFVVYSVFSRKTVTLQTARESKMSYLCY